MRRLGATASALGEKKVRRRSRALVRALSPLRQLEIDRRLLARATALGLLGDDSAAALDSRWERLYSEGAADADALARGKRMRRLVRLLRRLERRPKENLRGRLEKARKAGEKRLAPPGPDSCDRVLHRYRIAVKASRYLAEDLAAIGVRGLDAAIERERRLQDALGHWNDLRLFRKRLIASRSEAEERGAVGLVLGLDTAIVRMEPTVAAARAKALEEARRAAETVPFHRDVA
jgi:CHAD domain-containing protein